MGTLTLACSGDLSTLVRQAHGAIVDVPVPHPRSAKDAVEAVGIPHTEVSAIEVDGEAVSWDHLLSGGETVVVREVGDPALPPGASLQPAVPRPVRFVADVHLGTLARRLRVLGFDTWYRTDADDEHLARIGAAEDRALLSRDRQLLCRRIVRFGALVRADDPDDQLDEVVARFDLAGDIRPGTRCPRCNGRVTAVSRTDVLHRLEPGTRAAGYDDFRVCRDCDQLYWSGAHAPDLHAIVRRVRPSG